MKVKLGKIEATEGVFKRLNMAKVKLGKIEFAGGGFAVFSVFFAVLSLLTLWTDRNLEFWINQFSEKQVEVPFWLSLLLTLVLNGVIVVANVVSEILRLIF